VCKQKKKQKGIYKQKGTHNLARECEQIPDTLRTVPAVSFEMALFSTPVAPIFPATSLAITRKVPPCPTVIAEDLSRIYWTTWNLGKSTQTCQIK